MIFNTTYTDSNEYKYKSKAQTLNDLGLYHGVSATSFVPDLTSALTREQGVVMLLRLFGRDAETQKITNADEILSRFSDASSISDWAKKHVAYAVKNELVKGLPNGTIAPKKPMNGNQYCTLILRQLGYKNDYDMAPEQLADKGGISSAQAVLYTNKDLIRDDLVVISYGCLKVTDVTNKTVLENLVLQGTVPRDRVEAAIMYAPDLRIALRPAIPTTTPVPTVMPTPTPSPSPTPSPTPTSTPRLIIPPSSSDDSTDNEKPLAFAAQSQDNRIVVRFNEAVVSATSGNGARNPSNYRLLRIDGSFVENAVLVTEKISNIQYEVSFDTLTKGSGSEYIISITGICDLSGNTMKEYQQKLAVIPFTVVEIE